MKQIMKNNMKRNKLKKKNGRDIKTVILIMKLKSDSSQKWFLFFYLSKNTSRFRTVLTFKKSVSSGYATAVCEYIHPFRSDFSPSFSL